MQTPTSPQTSYLEELASLLLGSRLVSADTLTSLMSRAAKNPELLETMLLHEGYLTDAQLAQLKAQIHGWSYVNLDTESIDHSFVDLLPREVMRAQKAVLFRKGSDGTMHVAMLDPGNRSFVRLLGKRFGPLKIFLTTSAALASVLARFEEPFQDHLATLLKRFEDAKKSRGSDDTSILQLVDLLLQQANMQNASDIHIEPHQYGTTLRFRIDGILRKVGEVPREVHSLMVLRMKVLSNLPTDEHSKPLDGKLTFEDADKKKVDVRLSMVPTTQGEKVVLRLLAPQDRALPLDSLGIESANQKKIEKEISKAWGMVLVTGPTGSGKTTSLYACLRKLNRDDVNISTIEDPVEYDLPGVNQIQVNEKTGVTFATGLRSLLRQDPNVILVGEIRDSETAGIAVNASLTGHLLLATLHTNDAATSIPRMMDLGIEPFLIASTVNVIVAQRLVRKLCIRCRESDEHTAKELETILPPELAHSLSGKKSKVRLYKGKGCTVCGGTGYKGRLGIFEILPMTDAIRALVIAKADADTIRRAAHKEGMVTMLEDGVEKVKQGITTLDELLRVTRS